jgi:hypothetical protein
LYATKFLCAKWIWGVVSLTSSLCAREITLVPWQLQHSIYFTFKNVEFLFIYLKIIFWRNKIFGEENWESFLGILNYYFWHGIFPNKIIVVLACNF